MDGNKDDDSSTGGEEPPVESDENPNPRQRSTRPQNQRNQTNRNRNRKGLSYKCKCGKLKGEGKHICPFTLTFAHSMDRLPKRKLPFSNFDRWTTNNVPNEELTEQDRRHQKLWRETEGRREKARVVSGPPLQDGRIHKAPKGIGKTGQPQYCRCKQLRKPRHGHHCPYNTSLFDAAYLYQKSKDGSSEDYSLYDGWSGKVKDEQLQDFDAEWRDYFLGMGREKPIASPPPKRSKLGQSEDAPLLQSNLPADDDKKQPAVEREDGSGAILDQDVVEAPAVVSLPTPADRSEPSPLMDAVALSYSPPTADFSAVGREDESVALYLKAVEEDSSSDESWLDELISHSLLTADDCKLSAVGREDGSGTLDNVQVVVEDNKGNDSVNPEGATTCSTEAEAGENPSASAPGDWKASAAANEEPPSNDSMAHGGKDSSSLWIIAGTFRLTLVKESNDQDASERCVKTLLAVLRIDPNCFS